jgi:hypothetical protein
MRKRAKKLRTVRPGEARVGMSVLATTGALNLPPRLFKVKRVDEVQPDGFRPGLTIQSVEVEDCERRGGWEMLWDRPEAVATPSNSQRM